VKKYLPKTSCPDNDQDAFWRKFNLASHKVKDKCGDLLNKKAGNHPLN